MPGDVDHRSDPLKCRRLVGLVVEASTSRAQTWVPLVLLLLVVRVLLVLVLVRLVLVLLLVLRVLLVLVLLLVLRVLLVLVLVRLVLALLLVLLVPRVLLVLVLVLLLALLVLVLGLLLVLLVLVLLVLVLVLLFLLLLLQRSTAVQVRSSVRLMPQIQPSGRGLLPSPTAWSPDQHLAAMLADVSRHSLGRTEGRGLGVWSACPHSHREVSETPILFRQTFRPQCPMRRRKIVVCWARSSLQIGSSCAWCPPFSFLQCPLCREWRNVLASL